MNEEINEEIIEEIEVGDFVIYQHPVTFDEPIPKIEISLEEVVDVEIENFKTKKSIVLEKYRVRKVVRNKKTFDYHKYDQFRIIQNDDESMDLFFLTQCKVIILSRSTFALSSLYFTQAENKDIYIPLWGHLSCFGLFTKYDNCKFNYYF